MKSLRELHLGNCGLRHVPAFVRELSWLDENEDLQFDAPLDYMIECFPHLRAVRMEKEQGGTWTPQSLTHLWAFQGETSEEKQERQSAVLERVFSSPSCFLRLCVL